MAVGVIRQDNTWGDYNTEDVATGLQVLLLEEPYLRGEASDYCRSCLFCKFSTKRDPKHRKGLLEPSCDWNNLDKIDAKNLVHCAAHLSPVNNI